LQYEINKNTFLENNEDYEINYNLKNSEEVKLISPDNKLLANFIYKEEKKEETSKSEKKSENNNIKEDIKNDLENEKSNS
jgi:hypothetical protein